MPFSSCGGATARTSNDASAAETSGKARRNQDTTYGGAAWTDTARASNELLELGSKWVA